MGSTGSCDLQQGAKEGVTVGKLRVTISNKPTTPVVAADTDSSDDFSVDVIVQDS
jgi:hypothetical protein